ncbi:MAG: HAMP domain-containing histidine kinase [Oscillospiraceae bacterium]|nr:HAMP domain-containing histidine kinase [Oscillospiraceae bacterium]
MKAFNKIFVTVLVMIIAVFAIANVIFLTDNGESGRPYRVEISRLVSEIEKDSLEITDLANCKYVTGVLRFEDTDNFYNAESDYVVREINGELYRFDYRAKSEENTGVILTVNVVLGIMSAVIIAVMLYIRVKILKPFEQLTDVPYELSKGNLTAPVKETKNRFFGRFIWGVDMLRENMEQQKERELSLQRDKKMLLLSLSHDIKTPLSAIKLYSKALSKGLYDSKEKQLEIAESINSKADEIESYVTQIITASREDFLSLEVNNGEFYLSELVSKISIYYTEKLSLVKTDFTVDSYTDCLISGDIDRSVEVVQNIMENAIKYGDGKNIDISFSEEDGCTLITVRNSGCTLADTDLLHIFDSFWRGANAENQKGSGLGLYICRQLMHKMSGDIFAEIKDGFMYVTAVFAKA